MQGWTAERVQQLAPDSASAKAGQALATARHWVSSGTDANALWGECQGSGAKPYQVRIDIAEPAFKCSCPSRKFPCKHAIGLMLLSISGSVPASTRPAWVEEWFADRVSRAEKKRDKADAPAKPLDAVAQAKRKEDRLSRIADGLSALKLWLHDLARGGVASVPSRGYAFFDEQARRLIDAQAPGVARRVHALAAVASSGAGWQHEFLAQLASIYLLVRGFEQRESLPASARALLMGVIGVGPSQEEVLSTPAVIDRWQVVAQEIHLEDRLRAQHTWVIGERTATLAHLLAFAHGTQPFESMMPPGFAFEGEICLYPDGVRGVVKSKAELSPLTMLANTIDLDTLRDRHATHRARNPWLEGFVAVLGGIVPTKTGETWSVVDRTGRSITLSVEDAEAWKLSAVSGGRAIDLVVHFDGRRARPLAAFAAGEYLRVGILAEGAVA